MHTKSFIILRDNKENGPFSLEDLLQFSLQPHDLVWIEGESTGWLYPTEIDMLKKYVQKVTSFSSQTENKIYSKEKSDSQKEWKNIFDMAKHIYISLPTAH